MIDTNFSSMSLPKAFIAEVRAEAEEQMYTTPNMLQVAWKFYMEHKDD